MAWRCNMKEDEAFYKVREMIARWIYDECDTPIEEIVWLLGLGHKDREELERNYDAVFDMKKERINGQ